MIEHADVNPGFCDVEEMVRAAGGYLEVSDDLRPRTLEEARDDSRETSTRSWIAVLAVVVIFLAMYAGKFRDRLSSTSPLKAVVSVNCDQLYAAARQTAAKANVDPSWSLVDAFRGLRQRQLSLIEDAFWYWRRVPIQDRTPGNSAADTFPRDKHTAHQSRLGRIIQA
jgi:hypothetical protein